MVATTVATTVATDPPAWDPAVPRPATKASPRRVSRWRERNLLLNPAAVVGASLAVFLATFTALGARVAAGHDPAVGAAASVYQAAASGGSSLTTRTSGAAVATGSPQAVQSQAAPYPLTTASSGSAASFGGQNGGDEGA